ncbi:MAG: isochorismatase family protein [Desulfobacteraceae bacterium]|nr:MAG: isochorismatase family protein [Desulfobacteraceae bacterium]
MPQDQPISSSLDRLFIRADDAVLILIDIQEKLLPVMQNQEGLVQNALRLVKFAKIMGLPILCTEQEKLGHTVAPIRDELKGVETFSKLDFDSFGCRGFGQALERLQRKVLVVAGIEAHICVTQTVLHALCDDYRVHVVADAASARFEHNHAIAMQRMQMAGAVITSTEMFIYEVLGRAGTDTFREVLKLVK